MWSSMGGSQHASLGADAASNTAGSAASDRSETEVETWMILEYCNKGSLQVRPLRSCVSLSTASSACVHEPCCVSVGSPLALQDGMSCSTLRRFPLNQSSRVLLCKPECCVSASRVGPIKPLRLCCPLFKHHCPRLMHYHL